MISLITLLLEITLLFIIRALGVWEIDNVVASILIMMFTASYLVGVSRSAIINRYSKQLVAAYFFRLFVLFFDLFGRSIRSLPQSGADSEVFYNASTNWALYGVESRRGFFVYFMGDLFKLIGTNRLYAQFLLMLLSIASLILFVFIIDDMVYDDRTKERVTWILCLLPNYMLLSSIYLRESIVTFLITSSIYFFIKWARTGGFACYLFAILISVSGCLFHSGCIGITIGYVICSLLYDPYEQKIHASINGILLSFVFAIGVSFLFLNYGDSLLGKFTKLETMQDIANTNARAGSSYAKYVGNSNNPVNMFIFTIPRIVYFLFSPFPWQWRGNADIITFLFSGLFYLITIKNAIVYLHSKELQNREIAICLLIIAFFCTFIFAWGVSNTGTASRHRDKMVCLYGIIYVLTSNTGTSKQECRNADLIRENTKSYIYR